MYDAFSTDYDRFVNWPGRLAHELPFIEAQLKQAGERGGGPARVLDTACGTGMHAIALARKGYAAAGADLSAGMVERAQANAAAAGVEVLFKTAGFGSLADIFRDTPLFPFDALLCLGNSLPHLLTPQDLASALEDFAGCLRTGGLVLIQNRNFDALLDSRERWMEPQSHQEGELEWVFLRFYDWEPDDRIRFNILTLRREPGGAWEQKVVSTALYPLKQAELAAALTAAGFEAISYYGDMSGASFDPRSSGNLVVTAKRMRS